MERYSFSSYMQWLNPIDNNRNLISAFFYMLTIALISTSLVQLSWFEISGGFCVSHLSLYTFFTFGYSDPPKPKTYIFKNEFGQPAFNIDYGLFEESYRCITPKIVNMMRIIILLCFMAIIFSLVGFFLDILGPKSKIYDFIRRNSIAGSCAVFWIILIISFSYYIAFLIENSLKGLTTNMFIDVNFEYGFYTVVAAGAMSLIGITCNLLLTYVPTHRETVDRSYLVSQWDDTTETYPLPPPPPYSAPPPPYTP